jgi:hypothetical protein
MKKLIPVALLLMLIGVVFSGCKESSSLLDVTFEADYQSDMDVVVSPSTLKIGVNGVFSSSTTIDPLSNSDLAKYANNIKSVEILEAKGTILEVSSNATILNADLNISAPDMDNAQWLFTNEPIEVGNVIELTNANGQLDKLSSILSSKKTFTIAFIGETDEDNVTFTMRVYIRAKVTANPL